MTKYFLIKSIQRDRKASDREGWTDYTFSPINNVLKAFPKWVDEYNENEKRIISFEVYGVKGQETAVITLRGPKARVKNFPTFLIDSNFYEYFSLREVEMPEIYV
jgi:hypothetical protein